MTIAGRTQAYSAGNKTYGFGRSNPTSGPVDPLGYKERDAAKKKSREPRKMMMTTPVVQAISRRITSKPATAPTETVPKPTPTGTYQNAAPAPVRSINPAPTSEQSAGSLIEQQLKRLMAGSNPAQQAFSSQPNAGSQYQAAGGSPVIRSIGTPSPEVAHTYDPTGLRSEVLSGAPTPLRQGGDLAPQHIGTASPEVAAQPASPMMQGGNFLHNPTAPTTNPSAPPGYVDPAGPPPSNVPGAPMQGGAAQGVGGLGYDPAYAATLQAQQLAEAQRRQALLDAQNAAQTAAYGQDRAIDQQGQQTLNDLLNSYSGRGMAFSGAYGADVGQAQNNIAGAHTSNTQGLTDLLNGLQTNYANANSSDNMDLQTALQQYIANLAGSAGSLNLASGLPYQQQAGAGSDTLAALLAKLGITS